MRNSFRCKTARGPQPHPLAAALALCLAAPAAVQAQALPGGLQVVQGQATVDTAGARMTVTNSPNAVLNWRSFSIGAQQSVHFNQASSASQVLNRVTGPDPSSILGSLSSNGKVWLLNPHGVLFGAGARVDVAGLVVSTLHLADADFLAGRYRLGPAAEALAGEGRIVNQGELRTASGGRVALLASAAGVANEGLIEAPGGHVLLAAGRQIELVDTQAPNLALRVTAPAGEALNLGQVIAPSGRIDVQAAIVNQQGVMRADALAVGPGGELVLQATQQLNLAAGSQTTAEGAAGGGRLTLDAGPQGTALVAGKVAVTSGQGTGGTLQLLGRQVGVLDGGTLDASGHSGGGQVLVGGGPQGADPAVRNAQAAYVAPQATLAADATGLGDGGQVVVWADQATRAYGRFSARGGPLGGHGGLVETSGGWLDARPASMRVQAPRGRAGTWLLDPNDITIVASGSDTNIGSGPDFSSTDDGAQISATTIESALQAGNNVSITTGTGGTDSQAGDILMQNVSISPVLSMPVTLTLNAHNHIQLRDSSVSAGGAGLGITLNAAKDGGTGAILVSNTTLDSNGGNILLGGGGIASGPQGTAGFMAAVGADPDFPSGINLRNNSVLQAGNGSITLRGATVQDGSFNAGVLVDDNSSVQARDIVVQGWSNGGLVRTGVHLASGALIATRSLRVEGTALAATDPGGSNPSNPSLVSGVRVEDAQLIVQPPAPDTSASLTVLGTATVAGSASAGGRAVTGIGVSLLRSSSSPGSALLQAAGGASVSVDGTLSSADGGYALLLASTDYGGDIIDAAGAASLTVTARGAGQRLGLSGGNIVTPTGGPATFSSAGSIDLVDGSNGFSASINGGASSLLMQAQDDLLITGGSAVNFSGSATAVTLQSNAGSIGLSGAPFVASGGTVRLLAPEVSIAGSSTVSADAGGDALVVAGSASGNATSFLHSAASPAFNTPNGRWLVYATDPDGAGFDPGALVHDFRQYDAVYGSGTAVQGSGNGLLFSVAPTLALNGAVTKVYDGNTTVLVSAAEVQAGTGALSGDTVTVGSGAGTYADARVGTNKAVTVNAALVTATDEDGRPVYGYRLGTVTGEITPRSLTVGSLQVADKVYDGLTTATVSSSGLVGLVAGESLQLRLDGRFSDADAGTGKSVAVGIGLADGSTGSGLASDYVLATTSATASASITPRPLTLAAVADNKTYDGSDAATVRLSAITGLVSGEQLTWGVSGRFSDANAGTGKTVQVAVTAADGSGGRLANYQVPAIVATSATIDPRTLTYTATPVSLPAGSTLPGFTGQVGGFIEGENLANATTGTLRFTSPASSASPAGSYAIDGGGLAALNYRFEQAAANATALTLLPVVAPPPPPPPPPPAPIAEAAAPLQQSTPVELAVALATLLPEPTPPMALANRALDATQALAPQPAANGNSPRFGTVQVGAMSQDALAALLASRDRLKQQIFAQALAELAARPQAADVPACATPEQAETGLCMITVKQRDEIRAARQAQGAQAAGAQDGPAAAPAAAAAAAAPPQVPPPPAAATLPEAAPPLFPARAAVRSAALPQIQRKLAVLIGTDRYADSRIPQLDNAARDARAVAALLQSSLGYETLVIENGSKDTVMRTLNRLATEVGPNDSVVLYYAGHGAVVPTTGEGYWQPADADATRPETWISNADIGRAVERLGATQVALISDSCYSGTLVSDARIRATTAALDPSQVLSRRTAVVMSSGGNEPVFDAGREGHSPFAWNLMRTLQQVPNWQPGGNVFERVRFAVARELPQRPQYGAFSNSGYAAGADYLFEKRELNR